MVYGNETITVTPVANSIYDLAGNAASTSQSNNTATLNGIAQQLGSDIDGEAASDYFGRSVSMNSSGDRVAIGAYYNDGLDQTAGVTCASTNTPPVLGLSLAQTLMGRQIVIDLAFPSP